MVPLRGGLRQGWLLPLLFAAATASAEEWTREVPPFSFTERSGRTVTREDLRGRPWVADFFFCGCSGPCPLLSQRMAKLADELPQEVRLVSFTLDPEHDTPAALTAYAKLYGADPERWLFLTGDREAMRELVSKGFRQAVVDDPHEVIIHSLRFVLVDGEGRIRTWANYDDVEGMGALLEEAKGLVPRSPWPAVNASLNATCAVLLLAGLVCVKRKRIAAHKACMVSAFGVSIVFLGCYLWYHAHHGVTRFAYAGWAKATYFAVLGTHTVLAAAVPVLAIITLRRGFRGDIERHKRIARWTFPIWLYVSVTGVAVYWMLYWWRPG